MRPLAVLAAAGALVATAAAVEPGAMSWPGSAPPEISAGPRGDGLAAAAALPALAQEFPIIPYDGRFTFIRVSFESGGSGLRGFGRGGGRGPVWAHDYPRAEINFL